MDGKKISYRVDPLKVTGPVSAEVVLKFKNLRLESLRSNPLAYLSTFEREKQITDTQWEALILDPVHHYLICHTSLQPSHDTATVLDYQVATNDWAEKDTWVGMLYLLGPYTKADYGATPLLSSTTLGTEFEETRWHLAGLYLQPDSRCNDSAIAIHEAILDYLTFFTDNYLESVIDNATGLEKPKRARVAGMLRTENDQLGALYEALAGQTVGWADAALGRKIAGIEGQREELPMADLRMRVLERVIEC